MIRPSAHIHADLAISHTAVCTRYVLILKCKTQSHLKQGHINYSLLKMIRTSTHRYADLAKSYTVCAPGIL